MAQDDNPERKIDIKVDEQTAVGQYSNLAAIRHSREEFILISLLFSRWTNG